jgi:hypothetical protein
MARMNDDWLSCTIRTVELVMDRHGFVEDPKPDVQPSGKQSTNTLDWNKLLRRLALLQIS